MRLHIIRPLSLALALVASLTVILHPVPAVHAASVPAVGDAEASAEAMMLLWDMLVNGMIIGGAGEMKADYDTEKGLFVAFMDRLSDVVLAGQPVLDDSVYELADGTRFSLSGLVGAYVDGTGALQIPDEETWSRYRVIEGGGGGAPDPEEPEDPDPFSAVKAVCIGNGFLAELGGFIFDLWNNDVEGFTAQQVFGLPDYYYDPQNTGALLSYTFGPENYIYGTYHSYVSPSIFVSNHSYCFIGGYIEPSRPNGAGYYYDYSVGFYHLIGKSLASTTAPGMSSGKTGFTLWANIEKYPQKAYTNIPIFPDEASALNYLLTGNAEGLLNGLCYDFPGLINSVPEVLSPLTGIRLSPSAVPGLNAALSDAVAPFPVAGLDPAENTQGYRDAVQGVVDDHAVPLPDPVPSPDPVPDPVPDPDPAPEPVPDPDPAPDDGSEDLEGYKRDLRRIFPFCVPFDLIHLIQVLTADPQAPVIRIPVKFEPLGIDTELVADLSIFDPLAALFRTGIKVLFILSLIMVSRDMVRG